MFGVLEPEFVWKIMWRHVTFFPGRRWFVTRWF